MKMFLDIRCPRCGQISGNGGIGDDVFCPLCGYSGTIRLDEHDIKILNEIYQQHLGRNREGDSCET